MDKDGVHTHEQGARLVVHRQVVLPQAHTVGLGFAKQRKGTGQGGLPSPLAGGVERELPPAGLAQWAERRLSD